MVLLLLLLLMMKIEQNISKKALKLFNSMCNVNGTLDLML
jgi:hypothetical protein